MFLPQPGMIMAGRYRLERQLGQGGMGTVFAATDLALKRPVALKLLRPEASNDDESLSRFALEARAVASLGHPHIGALFDFHAQRDPVPFLVMELIEGESLRALLDRERSLAPPRAVYIARQVLAALAAAHASGTVHRDVKPTNVMILRSAAIADLVKLVDFGVAKMADSVTRAHVTEGGVMLGTPQYMAPEQAAGLPVYASADVYAVGVCLFEMIAGYNPFAVGDVGAVIASIRDLVPPSLVQVRGDVPPELARIIARALEKLPNARFASADELSRALLPFTSTPSNPQVFATAMGPASGPTLASAPPFAASQVAASATAPHAPAGWSAPLAPLPYPTVPYANPASLPPGSATPGAAPPGAPAGSAGGRAPASRSSGMMIGGVIGGLVVITLVALGLAGALALRSGKESATVTAASAPPSAAPMPLASAAPALDAAAPLQAKTSASGHASPAPPTHGSCVCLPINGADRMALCAALETPMCRCQTTSNTALCPHPFTKCATANCRPACPDGKYDDVHMIAGAAPGGACKGYSDAWDRNNNPVNQLESGTYDCSYCKTTRTFPGPDGAPCKGFHLATAKPYSGRTDCR